MNGHIRVLLFLVFAAVASLAQAQNPELSSSTPYELKVPLVDYLGKPGFYQQALFKFQPLTGDWKLQSYQEGVPLRTLIKAEVTTTNEVPVQVLLKLTGYIGGCDVLGEITVRRDDNAFTVYAYYTDASIHHVPGIACIAAVWVFAKVVPLPVYGLKAGKYSYTVNGALTGEFTLNADNAIVVPPPNFETLK